MLLRVFDDRVALGQAAAEQAAAAIRRAIAERGQRADHCRDGGVTTPNFWML